MQNSIILFSMPYFVYFSFINVLSLNKMKLFHNIYTLAATRTYQRYPRTTTYHHRAHVYIILTSRQPSYMNP